MKITPQNPASAPVTNKHADSLKRFMQMHSTKTDDTENQSRETISMDISKLEYPWNGAFLEWQREFANEPR